jgi:choline monooxygenase
VCPYHGWTYSTTGRLTKATRLKGIKDFRAKDMGLKPVDVATWGPLVFVRLGKQVTLTFNTFSLLELLFERNNHGNNY